MYYGYYGWRRRGRNTPRKVKGGIKPDSKRGDIGQSWLADEWTYMLEEMDPGGEFTRGKTYARKGQVLKLSVELGQVIGNVQGSEKYPYHTSIKFEPQNADYWREFASILREQPIIAARVLVGEMPEDIMEALERKGLELFPADMHAEISCDCDAWTAMCRHALAMCYILAEEFDRDPFLYLKILGIGREGLLGLMGLRTQHEVPDTMKANILSTKTAPRHGVVHNLDSPVDGGSSRVDQKSAKYSSNGPYFVMGGLPPNEHTGDTPGSGHGDAPAPLPKDPVAFWGRPDQADQPYSSESISMEDAALPKQMGNFPMWRGDERFVKVMEPIYRQASVYGVNAHLGIRKDARSRRGRPSKTKKE